MKKSECAEGAVPELYRLITGDHSFAALLTHFESCRLSMVESASLSIREVQNSRLIKVLRSLKRYKLYDFNRSYDRVFPELRGEINPSAFHSLRSDLHEYVLGVVYTLEWVGINLNYSSGNVPSAESSLLGRFHFHESTLAGDIVFSKAQLEEFEHLTRMGWGPKLLWEGYKVEQPRGMPFGGRDSSVTRRAS